MESQRQTFSPITAADFAAIKAKAQTSLGLNIGAETGRASCMGADIEWEYDPGGQTLSIQANSKPFFVSWDFVSATIRGAILEALNS